MEEKCSNIVMYLCRTWMRCAAYRTYKLGDSHTNAYIDFHQQNLTTLREFASKKNDLLTLLSILGGFDVMPFRSFSLVFSKKIVRDQSKDVWLSRVLLSISSLSLSPYHVLFASSFTLLTLQVFEKGLLNG